MTRFRLLAGTAALVLTLGAQVGLAQTTLVGIRAVDDRINDIDRTTQIDIDRASDEYRYGSPEYRQGLSGSASLGYSGKTGLTDSSEFSLGARLRFASGPMIQNIGLVMDFSEAGSIKTKEDVFAVYEANYYFDDSFYGFALGRVKSDGLAALATDVKTDAFIGFGPGYRLINTQDVTLRVQAGLGVSYLEDGIGDSETETGYIASARFYARLTDGMFVTNDIDALKSDSALRINNDLGLNFKMSEMFATRVSYLTEYNDSRAQRSENKLGVSLVYSF
jgi:putative salt-induced outer membrane protein